MFFDYLSIVLVPLLLFAVPVAGIACFVVFLVLFLGRRSSNKALPPEMQKSTRGYMIGFIISGVVVLTVAVLLIVLIGMIDNGAIRLM